jgi:NADH dehydrogenase
MSANGVSAEGTPYEATKYRAERHLAGSGLSGTVFRPSVVFGDPRGRTEFCTGLRDQMVRPPIPAPAFFTGISPRRGTFSMTPVHVRDVAAAFAGCLDRQETVGETYSLGGADTLEWPEILRRIATASGRRKLIVPVPALPLKLAAGALDRFPFFPVTRDQLEMLLRGNVVTSRDAFELMGIEPTAFSVEALSYLRDQA